jgi:hypothetical protein
MNVPTRPLAEVTERAISALVRELGVADTARFLQQFGPGYGDYTKDREELFGHLNLDEVIERSRQHGRERNA